MPIPGEAGASRPFQAGLCTEAVRAGTELAQEQQGERTPAQRGCRGAGGGDAGQPCSSPGTRGRELC